MKKRFLTPEALWGIPRVGTPVASPDGLAVAVGVTTHDNPKGEPRTRTWLITGGKAHPLTRPDEDASPAAFSSDGRTLALVRQVPKEGKDKGRLSQVALLNLRGGEAPTLTHMPLGAHHPRFLPDGSLIFSAPLLAEAPTMDGTRNLLAERNGQTQPISTESRLYRFWDHWIAGGKVIHLFRMPATGGVPTDLIPRFHRCLEYMSAAAEYEISPDGRYVAFNAPKDTPPFKEHRGGVWILDLAKKGATPKLVTKGQGWSCSGGVFSPNGRHLVYGMQVRPHFYADRVRLMACELRTGRHKELTRDFDRSPSQWFFDAHGRLVISAEDEARHSLWTLDVGQALRNPLVPRKTVTLGNIGPLSSGGRRLFASVDSLSSPPEVWAFDGRTHKPRAISSFTQEALRHLALGSVSSIWYRGADSDKVRMFLVSPPGVRTRGPRPLVHFIHGGPHGIFGDQWHWRWNPHVIAARGHRVALVNFHGSSSFGNDFCASILGQWGAKPFEDIEKASDLLVARGLAHPRRMAVAGGSYGGYLTSWICSQTNRYRCAVTHAGVNDLQSQFATDVAWGRPASFGGDVWRNIEGLDRFNPMRFASAFKTPMLISHGERDYRVPYTLGLQLYNVLKAKAVPARLLVYPDENHWILKRSNSLHWFGEFLGWIDRWLK
ncbi:MAG: prolyl oligopeptidase family serine peptidase [Planctomycetota bacterium]